MQKTLDLSIKKSEIGNVEGGYYIKDWKTYPYYMDNDTWDDFKRDMETNYPNAFAEYGAGSGGEMKEKGKFPPKMASYGSSSRMIYNLCKDIPDFCFEYKLPTRVGGIANLDGFLETSKSLIFTEAKCREPYGTKNSLIEVKYKELYQYINAEGACNLNIKCDDEQSKIKVCFSVSDKPIINFDIKQMICHLLGIAAKLLNEPSDKKISFVYLCYNPKLIEIIDEKKKPCILKNYENMCDEYEMIDFKSLFRTILIYLRDVLSVGRADADIIKIEDTDYALWYRDLIEEADKYNGKQVKFRGITAYDNRMPDTMFVAGRHVMTCCIDDVEYMPVVCITQKKHSVKSRDWFMVTGTVKNEYCKLYKGKGPVIYIDELAVTSPPEKELATFY